MSLIITLLICYYVFENYYVFRRVFVGMEK